MNPASETGRPAMQLFFDQVLPLYKELPKDEFGELMGALLMYSHDGTEPDFAENRTLRLAFALLRGSTERSADSYDEMRAAKSRAGHISAKKREQKETARPTAPVADIDTGELIRRTEERANRAIY